MRSSSLAGEVTFIVGGGSFLFVVVCGGGRVRRWAGSTTSAWTRWRRESMPGEFFYHSVYKKILTNHFYFVAFKFRKANDGDDDVKSGERWPVIARAVLERPIVVRAIG